MVRKNRPKPETPTGTEKSLVETKLEQYVKPDVLTPAVIPPENMPELIDKYLGEYSDAELLADQMQVEKKIMETFPPEFVATLKRFAYYLSTVGLAFEEACIMVRFKPEDMTEKIKKFPIIQELIDVKELEYKVSLIKAVSKKATTGDDKLAMWLLERRFPHEFNPKKGSGAPNSDNEDLLGAAIEFIQKSSDKNPLVKETSGRAFLFKKNSGENIITAINDVLK